MIFSEENCFLHEFCVNWTQHIIDFEPHVPINASKIFFAWRSFLQVLDICVDFLGGAAGDVEGEGGAEADAACSLQRGAVGCSWPNAAHICKLQHMHHCRRMSAAEGLPCPGIAHAGRGPGVAKSTQRNQRSRYLWKQRNSNLWKDNEILIVNLWK